MLKVTGRYVERGEKFRFHIHSKHRQNCISIMHDVCNFRYTMYICTHAIEYDATFYTCIYAVNTSLAGLTRIHKMLHTYKREIHQKTCLRTQCGCIFTAGILSSQSFPITHILAYIQTLTYTHT